MLLKSVNVHGMTDTHVVISNSFEINLSKELTQVWFNKTEHIANDMILPVAFIWQRCMSWMPPLAHLKGPQTEQRMNSHYTRWHSKTEKLLCHLSSITARNFIKQFKT